MNIIYKNTVAMHSNNVIKNINTVTTQIDNNSTVNDMLFYELIMLFHHA